MMQELNYIRCGDYYIPDIRLPEESRPIGRWGRMHRDYIKEHNSIRFNDLCLSGEYHIDMLVKTSGLTKQEYIIKRLMCEDITIHPNSRILKILCQYLTELTEELKRVEHIGQEDDVLENITYLVELIAKIKD